MNDANMIVYFDMDGVLAKYNRSGYVSIDGKTPPYLMKDGHYFFNLEPDEKAIAILQKLNEVCSVKILTAVSKKGSIYLEHVRDKIAWINKYCPFIDIKTQFISTATDKGNLAKSICDYDSLGLSSFSINHILIDDYNNNLNNWVYHGGTALKYINGINSESSYNGITLDQDMSVDDVVELITKYLNYL